MFLLYCDETNFIRKPGNFFVYGGLAIDAARAGDFSRAIEEIRTDLQVPREYLFKFNPGPEGMAHDRFVELKRRLMRAAVDCDCKLLVNLLLHDISESSEKARRFGVNTLCYHFDCFLNRRMRKGIVIIDRFSDKQIDDQLRERLSIGLTGHLPYSREMPIKNILGYHYAAIGQSHFCSAVDVILGSLRFSINAFTERRVVHLPSAEAILAQLSPLFPRLDDGRVSELGLWFSPKVIKSQKFRGQYLELSQFLRENGAAPAQAL